MLTPPVFWCPNPEPGYTCQDTHYWRGYTSTRKQHSDRKKNQNPASVLSLNKSSCPDYDSQGNSYCKNSCYQKVGNNGYSRLTPHISSDWPLIPGIYKDS